MDQNNTEEHVVPVTQPDQTAPTGDTSTNAIDEHKLFAILGYILPFLFFIPLLQASSKNNAYARFHANQQLVLLALWVCVYVLQHFLYMIFFGMAFAIMSIVNLILLVLAIMGIVNAAQGKMTELPVIGQYNLLKYISK